MKSTFLVLLFLAFQYTLWVGDSSVWQILSLNQSVLLQQEKNRQLSLKTLVLKREIQALQQPSFHSSSLTEDYIRWKLGFIIKKGNGFAIGETKRAHVPDKMEVFFRLFGLIDSHFEQF